MRVRSSGGFVLEMLAVQRSIRRQIRHNDGKLTCRGTVHKFGSEFNCGDEYWTILAHSDFKFFSTAGIAERVAERS